MRFSRLSNGKRSVRRKPARRRINKFAPPRLYLSKLFYSPWPLFAVRARPKSKGFPALQGTPVNTLRGRGHPRGERRSARVRIADPLPVHYSPLHLPRRRDAPPRRARRNSPNMHAALARLVNSEEARKQEKIDQIPKRSSREAELSPRGVPRTVNGTGHTGPSEFCATSI